MLKNWKGIERKWFRRALWVLALVLVWLWFDWTVYRLQKPLTRQDITQWEVKEITPQRWQLVSVEDENRKGDVWLNTPANAVGCDTIMLLGGLEDGENLVRGADHLKKRANLVVMKHPIGRYFEAKPWKQWDLFDYLNLAFIIREEMRQNLSAYVALLKHLHQTSQTDPRFSQRILVAGGSFGGPFATITASLHPEKTAALMIVYGFTNFEAVITADLHYQGRIHFNLARGTQWLPMPFTEFKEWGVKVLARILGFLAGNMFKYGYLEYYLPQVKGTPVYFINGKEDRLVPDEAYLPMWEAAPEPKHEVWVEGDHLKPGDPAQVAWLVDQLSQWTAEQGLWQCESGGEMP